MDPKTHARYLDYRERHGYFGAKQKILGAAEFAAADQEHAALDAKGETRDDEEEQRYEELAAMLLRD